MPSFSEETSTELTASEDEPPRHLLYIQASTNQAPVNLDIQYPIEQMFLALHASTEHASIFVNLPLPFSPIVPVPFTHHIHASFLELRPAAQAEDQDITRGLNIPAASTPPALRNPLSYLGSDLAPGASARADLRASAPYGAVVLQLASTEADSSD